MSHLDPDLKRAIAVAVASVRRAQVMAAADISAGGENAQLVAAREKLARAAMAYCDRTGTDERYFERFLVDGDLGEAPELLRALLDLADALREATACEVEQVRVQAAGLVRAAVRIFRDWARSRDERPRDLDPRLDSEAFCRR